MDYKLALELSANDRNLRTVLAASSARVGEFQRKTEAQMQKTAAAIKGASKGLSEDWNRAAKDAEAAQKKLAENATKENRKAAQEAKKVLRETIQVREQAVQEVSRGLLVTSALLTAGIAGTANVTKNFEKEISKLGAAADASGEDLKNLRSAVLDAGAASVYSASEAAQGAQELAKAGIETKDIIGGGLIGSLNLAAAGQIEVAEAAEIAATALKVFNLGGVQMSHVADLIAAGAGKAQGGVHEMGFALKQSALVANQFGLSIEETIGALTMFASNGLIGSDAGTSFRTMLLRLNPQSIEAANKMKELGLSFYDANGQFIGFRDSVGQIQEKMSRLDDATRDAALTTIFGQDAIRAANIALKEGAAGYEDYIAKVNDFGYASRTASKNMDNLSGDLERLKGDLEVAIIGTGEQSTGVLRKLVQSFDLMVTSYSDLPDAVQGGTLALAGFVAAGTGAVGLVGTLIPKYRELNQALLTMGQTGQNLSKALRFATIGIGVAGAAASAAMLIYGIYAARKAEAKAQTDRLTEALRAERDGQLGASTAALTSESAYKKAVGTMKQLGIEQTDYLEALRGSKFAQDQVVESVFAANPALQRNGENLQAVTQFLFDYQKANFVASREQAKLIKSNPELAASLRKMGESYTKLSPSVRQSIEDAKKDADAKKDVRKSAKEMGEAMGLAGGQLEQFTQTQSGSSDELGKLAAALNFTREQLIEFGGGSEEMAEVIGKNLQDAMESTRKSFASYGDVIAKFGGDQETTAGKIKEFYKGTIKESEKFTADIKTAIGKGLDPQFTSRLLQAGPEAAGPVLRSILSDHSGRMISMVNESEKKLSEINSLAVQMTRITTLAVQAQTDQMAKDVPTAMAAVQAAYRNGGQISAEELNKQLGIGLETSSRLVRDFGLTVITGVNQVRTAVNNTPIDAAAVTAISKRYAEDPTKVTRADAKFADGGMLPAQATIQGPGTLVQWAEPETQGEAFIPLAPTKRQRSTEILSTVAGHFGFDLIDPRRGGSRTTFADGGIYGVFPPRKPSGNGVIAQATYDSMLHQYRLLEAAKKATEGMVGHSWQSIVAFLRQQGANFQVTSTTGGKHAAGSYHYAGKAVDLVSPDMLALFRTLERASGSLSELFYDPAGYSYKRGNRIAPIGGHSDHVHAATYDAGGYLKPGVNIAMNKSGRPEPVFTADQWDVIKKNLTEGPRSNIVNNIYGDKRSTVELAREVVRKSKPKR